MVSNLARELQSDPTVWERCKRLFTVRDVPVKTTLLHEGEIARSMYFVKKGCLRLWFNKDGKDVTFQFFFEEQSVSSLESFLLGEPSLLSLESIEPTTVAALGRREWDTLLDMFPKLREQFMSLLVRRMGDYGRLFLSRIKDSPQERYQTLLREQPEIVRRVPQHYVASYLGITPVSLSRIRGRLLRKNQGSS
jgi:CRP-like cAMP-binding protein